jgi:amino acid adenylation domain-containing protein
MAVATRAARRSGVHGLFQEQAARTPDAVALRCGERAFSYHEVDRWSNRLAHRLYGAGVRRGDRVGLHATRSAEAIVAMLAVLKAGAGYVPLEPNVPPERLRLMAADAGVRLILDVPPLQWRLSGTPNVTVTTAVDEPAEGPDVAVGGEDLFYVPYTSGSTGRPKGVEVPHRAIPGAFQGDYGDWGPGASVLHHAALSWDGHVLEVYSALLHGGCLWVYPGDPSDPIALTAFARSRSITTLLLPTQAFNTVATADPGAFAGLSRVIIGGEVASRAHLAKVLDAVPDLRIANLYGPVECTILVSYQPVSRSDLERPSVPIGRQVGDRVIHVLDERGDRQPDGVAGEAYIGGPSLAHGYLGQPRLTAERFVPDPLGGQPFGGQPGGRLYRTGDIVRRDGGGLFEFVGRDDDQVKVRGYRIELAEVEAVLREHPDVADAVVVLDRTGEDARLVGYVVAAAAADTDPTALRRYLRDRLPAAMVPSALAPIDRLPLTRTGKVDRLALPPLPAAGDDTTDQEPRTPVEQCVAGIWQTVLKVGRVGRQDDFFELGGHSLAATKVALELRRAFSAPVEIRHLYDTPVLADLAAVVTRLQSAETQAGPAISRAARRP